MEGMEKCRLADLEKKHAFVLGLISDLDKLTWLKVLACGNQQCHR